MGVRDGDGTFVDDLDLPAPQRAGRLEQLILNTPASERQPDPTVMWTPDARLQAALGQSTVNTFTEEIARRACEDVPRDVLELLRSYGSCSAARKRPREVESPDLRPSRLCWADRA